MLQGFEITVSQQGHVYTVSGKDAAKLHAKLKSTPGSCKYYTIGNLENDSFPMEKVTGSVANSNAASG